jgi:replication factor C small subunit
MLVKKPWVVSSRPQTLSEVIFTDDATRRTFERFVQDSNLPNLLLYGPPGTGKTSTSGALLRDLGVDEMDVLRINCSDEKIDALRTKVRSFAGTMPYASPFKVVQLEEMDYLGHDGMALLRSLIEEASDCRFIATCNYLNKVIPPLRSRFQEVHFNAPDRDAVLLRSADLLDKHGITFDVEVLDTIVSAAYPDFRKVIQLLELNSRSGTLALSTGEGVSDWKLELLPLLQAGDWVKARKVISSSASKEELQDIFRFVYDNLPRIERLKAKQDEAIVIIARYMAQHSLVADVEINVAAMLIELGAL